MTSIPTLIQNDSSRPFGIRLFISGLMLSLLSTLHAAPWQAAQREPVIAQNLAELGDSALENAQLSWAESLKDSRKVVDTVCLVPNRETFLEALATWDDATYFPILIDDTDLSIKFIRAFKPKNVVRFPSKAAPVTDENIWPLAVTNALRGMLSANDKPKELIKGNVLWLQKQPRIILYELGFIPMGCPQQMGGSADHRRGCGETLRRRESFERTQSSGRGAGR